jgi:RNA polymerase sigma factor (sigma-70 family)
MRTETDLLAEKFEDNRPHLRAVAYRMLGSVAEAEDAVQESWLRLSRADADGVDNLRAWLTTVVGRVCLDMLRRRRTRGEEPLGTHVPDPVVVVPGAGADPEQQALLAHSVGLALQVVLDSLGPAERLAFVLHDMFALPFEEIAPIVGRSPGAARQLASRARRRVRGAAPATDASLADQREIVDAFIAAARDGDLETLVAVLDPDVVLRIDRGAIPGSIELHGAGAVAERVAAGARTFATLGRPVLVNGTAGVLVGRPGHPFAVAGFTIVGGRIAHLDILADPARVRELALPG